MTGDILENTIITILHQGSGGIFSLSEIKFQNMYILSLCNRIASPRLKASMNNSKETFANSSMNLNSEKIRADILEKLIRA